MTVLILSEEYDPSVDRVVLALDDWDVPVVRVDLAWFPQHLSVDAEFDGTGWNGGLRAPERYVTFVDLRAVWYRRPTPFTFPGNLTGQRRAHAEREARFGLGGVLASIPAAWMNHPHRDAEAVYKPRQLALASRCGLRVPRTLVTNEPDAVRRFAEATEHGIVTKMLGSNVLVEGGHRYVAHTQGIREADLTDLDGVELTAHLFQEWVPKAHEVRVVAVGYELFAVAIHTDDPEAHVDWRANYDVLRYAAIDVPDFVAAAIREFLTASGLAFSALDFVVRPDGRWVFLESNPGGQYGWLHAVWGTAISDAIAAYLAHGGVQR
ncbi:ATP-grasp ribosomal peptide maturase [Haloechinothrix sp. LS1_15]|nr:ATP-grasp ribosomal peptide maturase [Haloechinothrix sp. LS1_15]